jgi:putative phage-type endonuclease
MEQRTEAWYQQRMGKVTASRVADIVAKTKSSYSASRANYMAELICERLTGVKGDSFQNAAMQWGVTTEPQARAAYEASIGVLVTEIGFIPHFAIDASGASPDGFVGEHGLIEIKCPKTATHIETLLTGTVPAKYIIQMQWQMACTGRAWCDFVSYDPRLPESMQLFVKRVESEPDMIAYLEKEVLIFLEEMDEQISKLEELYNGL